MDRIEQLKKWVETEGKRREVEVKISAGYDGIGVKIWAYDYDLGKGMFVPETGEIDPGEIDTALERKAERELYENFEKLKAKIEAKQASKV